MKTKHIDLMLNAWVNTHRKKERFMRSLARATLITWNVDMLSVDFINGIHVSLWVHMHMICVVFWFYGGKNECVFIVLLSIYYASVAVILIGL